MHISWCYRSVDKMAGFFYTQQKWRITLEVEVDLFMEWYWNGMILGRVYNHQQFQGTIRLKNGRLDFQIIGSCYHWTPPRKKRCFLLDGDNQQIKKWWPRDFQIPGSSSRDHAWTLWKPPRGVKAWPPFGQSKGHVLKKLVYLHLATWKA